MRSFESIATSMAAGVSEYAKTVENCARSQALPIAQNPLLQVKPQLEPLQVAVAPAGGTQAEHELPQDCVLEFDTHVLPQRWKPAAQVKPQLVPLHVAIAFAGVVHGVHDAPQLDGLEFDAHCPLHG